MPLRSGHVELDRLRLVAGELDVQAGQAIDKTIELHQPGGSAAPAGPTTTGTEPGPALEPEHAMTGADESGGSLVPAFAMTGVTVALAVATGVVGGLALKKGKDYDALNTGADPAAAQDARDSAKTLNTVTDVLLGVTVAAAAVTVVLYVVQPGGDGGSDTAFRVLPAVGPEGGGMVLQASF